MRGASLRKATDFQRLATLLPPKPTHSFKEGDTASIWYVKAFSRTTNSLLALFAPAPRGFRAVFQAPYQPHSEVHAVAYFSSVVASCGVDFGKLK